MQEIFERIIEEFRNYIKNDDVIYETNENYNGAGGFVKAIKIVEQASAEYNNGWIPCSERLPGEYEDVEVTIEEIADEVGGKRYYNVRSWLRDGQWVIKKNPYHPTVIAWKYPTKPYQKGE